MHLPSIHVPSLSMVIAFQGLNFLQEMNFLRGAAELTSELAISPIFMSFVFSELHFIYFIDKFKTQEGQETLASYWAVICSAKPITRLAFGCSIFVNGTVYK